MMPAEYTWVRRIYKDHPRTWLERVYAKSLYYRIPWDDGCPHPKLLDWLKKTGPGRNRTALDVGCGLGYNAEALAASGYRVRAIDVAPSAIERCRYYAPTSEVVYEVANLFSLPMAWRESFDLVFEAAFLQVIPKRKVHAAFRKLCDLVKSKGKLVTICRLRRPEEAAPQAPPWSFSEAQLMSIACASGMTPFETTKWECNGVFRAVLTFARH
jgi:2-polyprenyl-3-methyl-5-hydroxy-6-metoxy-1,4-benzoquinol methylase